MPFLLNPTSLSSSSTSIDDPPESYELSKRPRPLSASMRNTAHYGGDDDNDNGNDNDDDDDDDGNYELDNLDDLEATSPTHGLLGTARNSSRSHRRPPSSSSPFLRSCASCASKLRLFSRHSVSLRHRFCQLGTAIFVVTLCLLVFTFIFNPSYTHDQYPKNYKTVTDSVRKGGGRNPAGFWRRDAPKKKATVSGRGNPNGVKVFVAANIINAELIAGPWGDAIMELMDLIGEKNVFLSIFENDSGDVTKAALKDLDTIIATRIPAAGRSIVSTSLSLKSIPRVKLPTGETYIKRITYLAEIRNRAMLPLVGYIPSMKRWGQERPKLDKRDKEEDWEVDPVGLDPKDAPMTPQQWVKNPGEYKKVLFLNDVVFDPVQALHLLFSTNGGEFTAACGLDFINPFKFYDTFALRDIDGWNPGVPFFPYFAPGRSRPFVEAGSDIVPVKSCWGGIVAFDASVFLDPADSSGHSNVSRGDDDDEDDGDHDDDDKNKPKPKPKPEPTQKPTFHHPVLFRSEKAPYWDASECCLIHADIAAPDSTFVNPFIRVAYDEGTFKWLPIIKRIERLFRGPHWLLAKTLRMPWGGDKREEGPTGYCGSQKLLVLEEDGGRGWKGLPVPSTGTDHA